MPLCDGRPPGGSCPDRRNDSTVRLSQGDFMLCRECERFRFPYLNTKQTVKPAAIVPETKPAIKPVATVPDTADEPASSQRIVVLNDVLCFLQNKLHNYPEDELKPVVIDFYREEEVLIYIMQSRLCYNMLLTSQ